MALTDNSNSSRASSIFIYRGVGAVPVDSTHVRVDASSTDIPQNAFASCRDLREVELPEGLQRIGESAFAFCTALTTVNIPSTVTVINQYAFRNCSKLEGIILPQGLVQLGSLAFYGCDSLQAIVVPPLIQILSGGIFWNCTGLTHVTLSTGLREIQGNVFTGCTSLVSVYFPSSLKRIWGASFSRVGLSTFTLPDSIESIGQSVFANSSFTNFRMPPLVAMFEVRIFDGGNAIVSIELSEGIEQVTCNDEDYYIELSELRNIAFPRGVEFGLNNETLESFVSLAKVFPDKDGDEMLDSLRRRFEGLPIHNICYYHSYRDAETVLMDLKREINPWAAKFLGKLNETGKRPDCLGMTPLHILACSTKHELVMFQLLVEKYPETLVTKDKWGDTPLTYALWCNAPRVVIQFLVESYQVNYPDYEFDWEGMIITMANSHAPLSNIQNLMDTHRQSFPNQKCDLKNLVITMVESITSPFIQRCARGETFRFLLHVSISERLNSLNVNRWRTLLEKSIDVIPDYANVRHHHTMPIYAELEEYELLKEATSVLELALWKVAIDNRLEKKSRIGDGASYRDQCRINCCAEIVIRNVMPFFPSW